MAEAKAPAGRHQPLAIEVADIGEALDWYGKIFDFTLRGRGERNAFIDMGDQFINFTHVPDQAANGVERRHIGLSSTTASSVKHVPRRQVPRWLRDRSSISSTRGATASKSSSIRYPVYQGAAYLRGMGHALLGEFGLGLVVLSSANPIPRRILRRLGKLDIRILDDFDAVAPRARKSRNGPSTILAPAASARAFTEERSSTTKPICRRSTPLAAWSGTCVEIDELVAHVDEGIALAATAQCEIEDLAVPVERFADVGDLDRDVVDATSRGFLPSAIVPSSREQIASGHMGRPTRRVQAQHRLAAIEGTL